MSLGSKKMRGSGRRRQISVEEEGAGETRDWRGGGGGGGSLKGRGGEWARLFSFVNKGLRHINHMIFSLCLFPLPTFLSSLTFPSILNGWSRRCNSEEYLDTRVTDVLNTRVWVFCVWLHWCGFFLFAHYSTHPAVKPYENNTAYHVAPLLLHRSAVSEMLTLVFHGTPFPSSLTHSCLSAKGMGVLIVCFVCVCVCFCVSAYVWQSAKCDAVK